MELCHQIAAARISDDERCVGILGKYCRDPRSIVIAELLHRQIEMPADEVGCHLALNTPGRHALCATYRLLVVAVVGTNPVLLSRVPRHRLARDVETNPARRL